MIIAYFQNNVYNCIILNSQCNLLKSLIKFILIKIHSNASSLSSHKSAYLNIVTVICTCIMVKHMLMFSCFARVSGFSLWLNNCRLSEVIIQTINYSVHLKYGYPERTIHNGKPNLCFYKTALTLFTPKTTQNYPR